MPFILLVFTVLISIPSLASPTIFHPLCIEEFVEDKWEKPFDMKECTSRNPMDGLKPVENAPKPTYYADRVDHLENGTGAGWSGYVQYTIAGRLNNIYDIEYIYSGGGTGSFSRIFTFRLNDDGKAEMLAFVSFGDRCNDGYAKFEKSFASGDSQVIISSEATPFRLLNASNRYDWRNAFWSKMAIKNDPEPDKALEKLGIPNLFNGWSPYEDIANSAASCSGRIHWKFDDTISEWFPVKFEVSEDAFTREYVSQKDEIKECLNAWNTKYSDQFGEPSEEKTYSMSAAKWFELIETIPEFCEEGPGLMGWLNSKY